MKRFWQRSVVRQVLVQSALFVGMSAVVGALTFDRARLPSDSTQALVQSMKPVATITIDRMQELIAGNKVVCVDARSASEFEKGHIRNAVSLPVNNFDQAMALHIDLFTQDKPIVIYCSGEGCDLSRILARKLATIGFDRISIFPEGWNAWKTAHLPIDP